MSYEHHMDVAAASYWNAQTKKMIDFSKKHPNFCFSLKYEELCENPTGILQPMFEFLNEAWEPQVLDFARQLHDSGLEDSEAKHTTKIEIRKNRFHSWPQDHIDEAQKVCAETLSFLSYEL